jgi:O-antigen ligase
MRPESQFGRIAYEAGWLGVLCVVLWRVWAVVIMWKGLKKARDPKLRAGLAAALGFFLALRGGSTFVHYANTLTWCVAAVGLGCAASVLASAQQRRSNAGSGRSGSPRRVAPP